MRRARPRQLTFAFADSPQGGKDADPPDESDGEAYLLHIAKDTDAEGLAAAGADRRRLLERVASKPNLAKALLKVARNRGAPGVDGRSVEEVVRQVPRLLTALQRALLKGEYRPGEIRRVWIPKPGGGQRGLGIPNVVDRWVQQAVLEVIEPIFEPTFHTSSHGFRPGRGAPTAIAEAKAHLEAGFEVVVDLDLSKFFDRVNHQRLLSRLSQRMSDGRILDLVRGMLKAKVVMPDGTCVTTEEGTPQGGPLSPILSNIVLDELDWELERRGLRFVRYADDANIYVRSERAGKRVMESTRRFIESRLRLKLNEEKSSVTRPDRTHFLGFRFVRQPEGPVQVHLSRRSKQRMDARIRELTPRSWGQSLSACMEGVSQYVKGWMSHFRLCTQEGVALFDRFDAHIRRRIRAIIIKQKKRPRHFFRHLLKRGLSRQQAFMLAYSQHGVWYRSLRFSMTQAYPNAWFADRLLSLRRQWTRLNCPPSVSGQLLLFDL